MQSPGQGTPVDSTTTITTTTNRPAYQMPRNVLFQNVNVCFASAKRTIVAIVSNQEKRDTFEVSRFGSRALDKAHEESTWPYMSSWSLQGVFYQPLGASCKPPGAQEPPTHARETLFSARKNEDSQCCIKMMYVAAMHKYASR